MYPYALRLRLALCTAVWSLADVSVLLPNGDARLYFVLLEACSFEALQVMLSVMLLAHHVGLMAGFHSSTVHERKRSLMLAKAVLT